MLPPAPFDLNAFNFHFKLRPFRRFWGQLERPGGGLCSLDFLENRENIVFAGLFLSNYLAEFGITKVLLLSARAENDQRTLKEGSIEQILKYSSVCLVEPWKQAYFWLLAYSPVTSSVTNNRARNIGALIMKNLAEAPVVQQAGFNSSKLSCSLAKSNQISALLSALLIKYPPQAPWRYHPFERTFTEGRSSPRDAVMVLLWPSRDALLKTTCAGGGESAVSGPMSPHDIQNAIWNELSPLILQWIKVNEEMRKWKISKSILLLSVLPFKLEPAHLL